MKPGRDLLREIFFRALHEFTETEVENVMNGTSERNLCARLGFTLETGVKKSGIVGYYADPEYNRKQQGRVKTILDEHEQIVKITCDLILHSRGEFIDGDNLIAVEMKRREHPEVDKQTDRIRLRAMTMASYDDVWSADGVTHPEHVCGYMLGYFIELDAQGRRFLIEEYQSGGIHQTVELKF